MDKQKQIEEMARDICNRYSKATDRCRIDHYGCNYTCGYYDNAKTLYEKGYRKIPEGAVVLTETEERIDDLLIEFDEMSFYPATLCPNAEEYVREWKRKLIYSIEQLRKETAEKFAEMAKELLDKQEKGWSANMIWIITAKNCIDEICKELGGDNG